jgi:S1-C subfamily serine protease
MTARWLIVAALILTTMACTSIGQAAQQTAAPAAQPIERVQPGATAATSEPGPTMPPGISEPQVQNALSALEVTLSEIYERVNPAVVNVDISARPSEEHESVDIGTGSGFVVDAGHTNIDVGR